MDSHEKRDETMMGGMEQSLTCKELVELVTAYRDGALPPHERARFEAHLAICPPCVRYVEQVDTTVRALGGLDAQAEKQVEQEPATQELLQLFRTWKSERQA